MLQRALQSAIDRDDMMRRCAPMLILAFTQLGYDDAAKSILRDWQRAGTDEDPPPADLDSFFQSDRAAALSSSAGRRRAVKPEAPPAPSPPGGLDAFFGAEPAPADNATPSAEEEA